MAQLEKEIVRLEHENTKLKRDSADYENRLAAYGANARFDTDFPTLNRVLRSTENNYVLAKPEKNFSIADNHETNEIRKRKVHTKTKNGSKKESRK